MELMFIPVLTVALLLNEDYGADAIIEFGSEEEVRTLIEALEEELERANKPQPL